MRTRIFAASLAAAAWLLPAAAGAIEPASAPTFDWILGGRLPASPPVVDFLGLDAVDTPAAYVAAARRNGSEVWCYVSAGTLEDWRPDRKAFEDLDRKERRAGRPPIIGRRYPDWPDERWLNFTRYAVFLPLMKARVDVCHAKRFTMIEFDNLDAHENRTGFRVDADDVIAYARALASYARGRGLVPIQKNVPELTGRLEAHFGAVLFEDCALYRFCGDARAYVDAGKPALAVEYPEAWKDAGRRFDLASVCATAARSGLAMIAKRLDLDAWTRRCP
jgi:hypothetical protein